jgi:hypothetical protein
MSKSFENKESKEGKNKTENSRIRAFSIVKE